MKRSYFITIATTLALLLIVVWVYILFFSTTSSESRDSFAELNFNDTTDGDFAPSPLLNEPVVDLANTERLRQLTTKPVVGFTEIVNASGTVESVYYTEAGTGHVFDINLTTGEEKRISATTFANIKKSDITPNGRYIMMETGVGTNKEFVLGELSTTTNDFIFNTITENIVSFTATRDNSFLFTILNNDTLLASQYYPLSKTAEIIFEVPFIETVVRWGETATHNHYVYPKASARLEGYLYQARDGVLRRLPASGRGLTAIGDQEYALYSNQIDRNYQSQLLNLNTNEIIELDQVFNAIIDKCVTYPTQSTFICGTDNSSKNQNTPDEWYRGEATYSDSLWEINPNDLSFERLVDIRNESGRSVDTMNLELGVTEKYVYFQNKSDMTLWMFVLPEVVKTRDLENGVSNTLPTNATN